MLAPDEVEPIERIVLRRADLDAIIAHARREAPRECCGLGFGRGERVERVVRVTNLAPGNTRYEADPRELIQHFRAMDERGEELVVIYHSHPVSPPRPSATDLAGAHYPESAYLIVSLADPERPNWAAWQIANGSAREVPVVVEP